MKNVIVSIIFLASLAIVSCDKPRDNPLDPSGEQYVSPKVSFLAPISDTISVNAFVLQWKGNTEGNEFRYRIEDANHQVLKETVNFSDTASVSLDFLDDGSYTFTIYTRYRNQTDVKSYGRTIVVDAVKGPVLKFYKLKTNVSVGSQASVSVYVEDVAAFASGRVKFTFNKNLVNLVGVSGGSYVATKGFDQAIVPNFADQTILSTANANGLAEISTILLANASSGSTIAGTGAIIALTFQGKSVGSSDLTISDFELRDATNNRLQGLGQPPNAKIVVQ